MNDEMPRLLRYTKLGIRTLLDGELWVAIIHGSPGKGGEGVVVHGRGEAIAHSYGSEAVAEIGPGETFSFSANRSFSEGGDPRGPVSREVWGLDAAPPEVIAAWMKFKHLGKIP